MHPFLFSFSMRRCYFKILSLKCLLCWSTVHCQLLLATRVLYRIIFRMQDLDFGYSTLASFYCTAHYSHSLFSEMCYARKSIMVCWIISGVAFGFASFFTLLLPLKRDIYVSFSSYIFHYTLIKLKFPSWRCMSSNSSRNRLLFLFLSF